MSSGSTFSFGAYLFLLALPVGAAACSSGTIDLADLKTLNATQRLVATPGSVSLAPGQSAFIGVELEVDGGNPQPISGTVAWTSSAIDVAGIDPAGLITGVAAGACEVRAQWMGLTSDPVAVVVTALSPSDPNALGPPGPAQKPNAVASLVLSPNVLTLQPAQQAQLLLRGLTQAGADTPVQQAATWLSNATGVAAVSDSGVVTASAAGTAHITAQVGAIASPPIQVEVIHGALVSLAIASPPSSLQVADSLQLVATATYADGSADSAPLGVSWQSSNPAVVAVDSNGLATATGIGSASLTAALDAQTSPAAVIAGTAKTVVLSDFSAASSSLGDWGSIHTAQGGANSDGSLTVIYNAPGVVDHALQLSFTLDTGAWGFASVFTSRMPAISLTDRGISTLSYDLRGTGSASFSVCLDTPLVGPTNYYSRYCTSTGTVPSGWTHIDLSLTSLAWSGDPAHQDYTLNAGLAQATGFVWQFTGGSGLAGSLLLDNITLTQTHAGP